MSLLKEHILFDLDGTLTDSEPGILGCVRHALDALGREIPPPERLHQFLGPPLLDSFRACGLPEEEAQRAVTLYRERFAARGLFENEVYPGVEELLHALRAAGAKLYIATSKPTVYTVRILDHFGLSPYFTLVMGSELDGTRSRKEEVVRAVLEAGGVPAGRAVMVGDRRHDMAGARACGVAPVGVLYGYGSETELRQSGAWRLAATVEELQAVLLGEGEGEA